jgi:hypothetical protein
VAAGTHPVTLHIPDIAAATTQAGTLGAALAYAAAGWYILPVKAGTKDPGSIVGKNWPAKSSRDPKQISAWYAGTDHGIALHAGRSGAVILDVDNPEHVPDEVLLVMQAEGPYQSTRPDQPGRGHYLLANILGRRIGNSLGKLATEHKWGEIRGANGVIIAEPTTHPEGGRYRWERSGTLPPIPDYLADALPDSTTPEDTATDAQVKAFIAANNTGTLTEAVTGLANTLTAKLARGASCHMSTLGVVTDAMAEAAAGLYPARTAIDALWPIYRTTATTGTSTGRILTAKEAREAFAGILAWAIGQAPAHTDAALTRVRERIPPPNIEIITDDTQPEPGKLEQLEEDFWTARPALATIHQAALSRMASPWAVLACTVARLLCLVPPSLMLPAIIGGPGSLNWYAALSAKSGGGKGAAMAVASQLISADLTLRGIGSGEGMIEAYERSPKRMDNPPPPVTAVMFSVDEIDSLAAMGGRSGQTTMTILRQGFSGETLGFSYRGRRLESVAAHTYRMTLIASVQPKRAGVLFDDAGGGTPQRFMWFPARDRRISRTPPEWPTDKRGRELVIPVLSARDLAGSVGVIHVSDLIVDEIRSARAASMSGDDEALDGHALYVREKFAFALAFMDGRTDINDDDWKLSEIAANVSDWCRGKSQAGYEAGREDDARARGQQSGWARDEQTVTEKAAYGAHVSRLAVWVHRTVSECGPVTTSALNRRLASRDRPRLRDALDAAIAQGLIVAGDDGWRVER